MSRDYKVGYGKPPTEHQFKRGQSGNPAGRAKGSSNMLTMVRKAVNQPVTVNEGGRRKRVSKLEAALIQQSNKAASGDRHAAKWLTDLALAAEAVENAGRDRSVDQDALAAHYDTIMKAVAGRLSEGDDDEA